MGDLIFVAVVVAFFAVTVAYVKGCERIVGRRHAAARRARVDAEATTRRAAASSRPVRGARR